MSDIIYWLISVFIVGIFINLVSAYIKPQTDRILSRISNSYRKSIDEEVEHRSQMIDELVKNPSLATNLQLDQIHCEIQSAVSAIMVMLMLLIIVVISQTAHTEDFGAMLGFGLMMVTMMVLSIMGLYYTRKSARLHSVLHVFSILSFPKKK